MNVARQKTEAGPISWGVDSSGKPHRRHHTSSVSPPPVIPYSSGHGSALDIIYAMYELRYKFFLS
jgi:hypothetical protein